MERQALEEVMRKAWCRETSSDPDRWHPQNPAWGQCAVTALVVNDYLGGKLLWAEAQLSDGRKISHYFNQLEDGNVLDLTKGQFPDDTIIPKGTDKKKEFSTTRDYVLSFPQTAERYTMLKQSIGLVPSKG